MKVAIVGANGSIGRLFLQHTLQRNDVTSVVAITRKPDPSIDSGDERLRSAIIADFDALDTVPDTIWSIIEDADALIWAVGTYDLNRDVNYAYPLAFQEVLVHRLTNKRARAGKPSKLRFILLGGAFTETDQSRKLFFLPSQRRMKGALQTDALAFADQHSKYMVAHVIRPAGILIGWKTFTEWLVEYVFGMNLAVRDAELGCFVADLAVNGSERNVIENWEIVKTGRNLLATTQGRLNTSY
ncbi:hypothetical protein N0V86_009388 [Didymella sp. IMI 355093]|nr:hypothetical protein N0V86_009388 [Didymella sp. IMI 355093]